jgi:hypothetical protein
MLLSMQSLNVSCYWYDRPLTGRQFLDQVRLFLGDVRDALPELSTLKVVRDPKESTGLVAQDFSNLDQEIIASLPKDWAYINENPKNREFSDGCRPAISFRTAFVMGVNIDAADISIQVSVGSNGRNADSVIIHIAPNFESESVVRKLLDISVSFWSPHHATVTRSEIDNQLGQAIGDVRVGWLTYFSDTKILDYHSAIFSAEKYKSGVLIQASDGPISAADEGEVERIRKVIRELEPTGVLRNPKKKAR